MANSPWWLISAGIHAVLLLGASLYAIDRLVPLEDNEVAVVVAAKSSPVINEPERPRDVFEPFRNPGFEAAYDAVWSVFRSQIDVRQRSH